MGRSSMHRGQDFQKNAWMELHHRKRKASRLLMRKENDAIAPKGNWVEKEGEERRRTPSQESASDITDPKEQSPALSHDESYDALNRNASGGIPRERCNSKKLGDSPAMG